MHTVFASPVFNLLFGVFAAAMCIQAVSRRQRGWSVFAAIQGSCALLQFAILASRIW